MKKLFLIIILIFPSLAVAEGSIVEAKALHMKNCLANGGLKEICDCSFDQALQLMSLKDIEKYNQMIEAGYNPDIKTTSRLTKATMICNQKLRTNEEYINKNAEEQGFLAPPPPPPIPGSVTEKPQPLDLNNVDTDGIVDTKYIEEANKAAAEKDKVVEPVKPAAPKPVAQRPAYSKPKPKVGGKGYGEYDRDFFEAVQKGDLKGILAYSELISGIDVKNEAGDTALIVAARVGQMVSMKYLLTNGADANLANAKGQTALHIATYARRLDMVDSLLKAGAKVNVSYGKGFTPLVLAVMRQDLALVKALLAAKASVNMPRDDGNNELHIAVTGKSVEIINQLVAAGADKNKLNKIGNTPLMVAAYSGNAVAVQALLNLGADPNITDQYGRTALTLANSAGMRQTSALLMRATQGR